MLHATPHLATTNLAPHKLDAVRWSPDAYQDFMDAAGYDSIEVHPLRSRLLAQASLGRLPFEFTERIGSFHQGFRGESYRDLGHFALSDRPELRRTVPAALAFSEAPRSLNMLARIQRRIRNKKPLVFYPEHTGTSPWEALDEFSAVRLQPKPEYGASRRPTDNDADWVQRFARNYKLQGYEICLDVAHWDSVNQDGGKLPIWQNSYGALIRSGTVREIHLGPNRTDLSTADDGATLRALVKGKGASTELGRQINSLAHIFALEDQPFPYTVIEMTAEQTLQANNPVSTVGPTNVPRDLVEIHRDVTAAITELAQLTPNAIK